MNTPITVAYGDGIGPEIMEATLKILKAAKAKLKIEKIEVGEAMYKAGHSSGIPDEAWKSIHKTKVILKAPITTPQGGGYKSLNVTMRKTLDLYANVRPCVSYFPFVSDGCPVMDLVIVRENGEDLYTGIEHRLTDNMNKCLKLISSQGCERIVRYAFDYAVKNGRKKVTLLVKDNIMKLTDGLMHQVFNEIAKAYPEIENDHLIVDIGAARIAARPQNFDVVVTTNLYGDIVSDIAAEVSGSVGMAGSSNIGEKHAMFEAIHGSAPDIAGKGIANPSGLLMGGVMMLVHIGQYDVATRVHNALLATIEQGIHPADIYNEETSKEKVGTEAFTKAVIKNLGHEPERLPKVHYEKPKEKKVKLKAKALQPKAKKQLVGVDIFVEWHGEEPAKLAELAQKLNVPGRLEFTVVSNKGLKVWPGDAPEMNYGDFWRLRFKDPDERSPINASDVVAVLQNSILQGVDVVKTEHLYT